MPDDLAPIGNGSGRVGSCEAAWTGQKYIRHECKVHVERMIGFHPEPIMTIPESIYNGMTPLGNGGHDLVLQAMAGGKSSKAARKMASEDRLVRMFNDRRHEFLENIACHVFAKDAQSHEAYGDYSQLLGHPNQSQGTYPPMDDAICLLNIASDNASGLTFGDAGFCTFWIREPDLARRDFSNVQGQIAGA